MPTSTTKASLDQKAFRKELAFRQIQPHQTLREAFKTKDDAGPLDEILDSLFIPPIIKNTPDPDQVNYCANTVEIWVRKSGLGPQPTLVIPIHLDAPAEKEFRRIARETVKALNLLSQ